MKRYEKAADILSQLYKLAIVAGYASVTNECSFSASQQIDAPRKRSMTPYRECNITFLFLRRWYSHLLPSMISLKSGLKSLEN